MASKGNEALLAALPSGNWASKKVTIVKTEWNAAITDELEAGALRIFKQAGLHHVRTVVVPGAVEVPFAIKKTDDFGGTKSDAYIAFAAVIKGDTPHFDYVCLSITDGITQLNLTLDAPVIYGVLTVNTEQQALERIGGIHGHKGEEAAITALKMMALFRH